jgi:hypothetical protein
MERIKEQMVYMYLCQNHRGKDSLIKNKELRKLFNINSDKTMRKVIQNIRENENYKEMIGSVSGQSGGFFTCITDTEKRETINNIKHRAKEMLRMCEILESKMEG